MTPHLSPKYTTISSLSQNRIPYLSYTMLLHLIKKEMLEHLLSLRFSIACILCLVVVLASLLVLTTDHIEEYDLWELVQA